MIARKRERATLEALEDLVRYLRSIREERKAILTDHRGLAALWREPVADEAAGGSAHWCAGADSGRRPSRRRPERQADDQGPAQHRRGHADQERVRQRSHAPRHRWTTSGSSSTSWATRTRPTPASTRSIRVGFRRSTIRLVPIRRRRRASTPPCSRQRIEVMRTLAGNTDGIAVVNSNDLDDGMKRISDDLTSVLSPWLLLDQRQARRPVPLAESQGQDTRRRGARAARLPGGDRGRGDVGPTRGRRAGAGGDTGGQRGDRSAGARQARRALPHQCHRQRRRQAHGLGRR